MTDPTLARLRLRLTALYVAATAGFLVAAGAIAYGLIGFYFQSSTDLALRVRLAFEYRRLGLAAPADLASAGQEWAQQRGRVPEERASETDDHDDDSDDDSEAAVAARRAQAEAEWANTYDVELTAIAVIPLDAEGRRIVASPGAGARPFEPDAAAAQAAQATGTDLRTARAADGAPVRLFTYRLPPGQDAAVLQAGRVLTDQERIQGQLLTGLLGAGAVLAVLSALGSWWLAGRTLRPAQLAWERQRAFVANASHELRAPLTLIQLSAEVSARADTSDEERRELAGDVLRETRYMAGLVGDLLLLSRLDAGQLKLDLQPVDTRELLAEVQRDLARLSGERGITLTIRHAGGVAVADRARLRQVLLIVLDNAFGHTPDGGTVTLESAVRGRSVSITVTDTGSGIAPEHLARVFDRFYQADPARTPAGGKKGSAGLGLSIARSLTKAMRGQISIASEPGQGTQVTLTLVAGR